jgi:hypothetical protein
MKLLTRGMHVKHPASQLQWHRWFAWYPVPIAIDGRLHHFWLQSVERKWVQADTAAQSNGAIGYVGARVRNGAKKGWIVPSARTPLSLRELLSFDGKEPSLLLQTGAYRSVTTPLPLREWPLRAYNAHSLGPYLIFAGHYLIVRVVLCVLVRKLHASLHRLYSASEKPRGL